MSGTDGLGTVRTPRAIMRFAAPSIVMMVFISSYSVVDGVFVSWFMGTDALAVLNITAPAFSAFGAIAFMFETGGCAYVATLMGKGMQDKANRSMFQVFAAAVAVGTVLCITALLLAEPILRMLGADDRLLNHAMDYWIVLAPFVPIITRV